MNKTLFAYHLTHHFGRFTRTSYHTDSPAASEGDMVYVISGHASPEGGKDYALEGLFKVHRRLNGPFDMPDLKGVPTKFQFKLVMSPLRVPDAPIPLNQADWYDRQDVHRYFSSGQNFNPLPSGYQTRFEILLAGFAQSKDMELAEDLAEIERNTPNPTERETVVQARIGQGKFRADVTKLWDRGETCALTGIALPELLIASHIKPWRESDDGERLDPANGMLLATHVDKLFDRYLLSFSPQGGELRSVIAPRIQAVSARLGVTPGMPLATSRLGPSSLRKIEQYLVGHLAIFQEKRAESSTSR